MNEERQKQLEEAVIDCLRDNYYFKEAGDGHFVDEIYADYRDEMDDRTAGEILESDAPEQVFYEKLDEWYGDAEWERLCDIPRRYSIVSKMTGISFRKDWMTMTNAISKVSSWTAFPMIIRMSIF